MQVREETGLDIVEPQLLDVPAPASVEWVQRRHQEEDLSSCCGQHSKRNILAHDEADTVILRVKGRK